MIAQSGVDDERNEKAPACVPLSFFRLRLATKHKPNNNPRTSLRPKKSNLVEGRFRQIWKRKSGVSRGVFDKKGRKKQGVLNFFGYIIYFHDGGNAVGRAAVVSALLHIAFHGWPRQECLQT